MSSEVRQLHIVSFNVPYPPNYGGVIDVYYKIKALHDAGVQVHLHTFHYGREHSDKLDNICHKVTYYPRQKFYQAIYSKVPYIVGSRQSDSLLSNLIEDDAPVLFEGLHTCFYLAHPALKDKLKAVRMHNIEWDYYSSLGKAERNFFRKFYFFSESKKLRMYEEVLKDANIVLGISPNDTAYLKERFDNVHYLPAFHQNTVVSCKPGMGSYALYHGNLSVQENNQAAMYLTRKIFNDMDHEFKVAGHKPLSTLVKDIGRIPHHQLIIDPDEKEMADLVSNAHINILPTFQATGIKLKVLNALFNGRYCIVNREMVKNTGLEELCLVADTADEMKRMVRETFEMEFGEKEVESRKKVLLKKFSNGANAQRLSELLYSPRP